MTDAENEPVDLHTETVFVDDPRPAIAWVESQIKTTCQLSISGAWHNGSMKTSVSITTTDPRDATLFKMFFG